MKKNIKARPQVTSFTSVKSPDNIKIIDLGLCLKPSCKNREIGAHGEVLQHSHGLGYVGGALGVNQISEMAKILDGLGFVGQLEIEVISKREFARREKVNGLKHL